MGTIDFAYLLYYWMLALERRKGTEVRDHQSPSVLIVKKGKNLFALGSYKERGVVSMFKNLWVTSGGSEVHGSWCWGRATRADAKVEEGPDKKPIQQNLYEYITKPVYSGSFSEPALSSYSTIEELPRAISRYKHFGPLSPYLLVIRCTYSNRHGMTVSGLYIMTMRKVSGCIRCLHDNERR